MKTLLIFDASNYMFRAFYAAPPNLTNSKGFPVNALHLYTKMILAVIRDTKADYVAMAHEGQGTKFRTRLYPDYKGHRSATPELLKMQFPYFQQITDALGLKAYEAPDYEADDVIATLTKQARELDMRVIIASSDKDLMQLIEDDDKVVMFDTMAKTTDIEKKYIRYDNVIERFQVEPSRVVDVLALAGDQSDNIPGCVGIGEKTAGKLIVQFGSLETLMTRLHDIRTPAQRKNLEAFSEKAQLSKELVRLVSDVHVELELGGYKPIRDKVIDIFSKLDLKNLLKEVYDHDAQLDPNVKRLSLEDVNTEEPTQTSAQSSDTPSDLEGHTKAKTEKQTKASKASPPPATAAAASAPLKTPALLRPLIATENIEKQERFDAFLQHAKAAKRIGLYPFWLESKPPRRELLGLALATPTESVYINLRQQESLFSTRLPLETSLAQIDELLNDAGILKCVYGLKPFVQRNLLRNKTFDLASYFDIEMAAYLVHPDRNELSFESCAQEYLAQTLLLNGPKRWLGTGKKQRIIEDVGIDEIAQNAGQWAQLTEQMAQLLNDELKYHQLFDLYQTVDQPLNAILAQMEFLGITLETKNLKNLVHSFDKTLKGIEQAAETRNGAPLNLNSPKQVGEFLFEKLGLVPERKKKRNHGLSTDQETLESLLDQDEIVGSILQYRALSKLRSTYGESLAALVDTRTQRLHAQFNACITATTRLSSHDPNLQNIPSRDPLGLEIKRCFVAATGHSFIGADYSQIELRILAALSKEPILLEAFKNGEDIHTRTAAAIFEIDPKDVTAQQRQIGKTINFGIIYGMGASKLSREIGYSSKEAKTFLDKHKAQFPVLANFIENELAKVLKVGETRTILGHRRPMPQLYSPSPMERASGERIVLNAPIQGSASDIVKLAMIRFVEAINQSQIRAQLLVQVHDELLVECHDDDLEACAHILRQAMEEAYDLGLPLTINLKIGKNWADMA